MESIIFLHSLYSPLKVSAITRKCTKMSLLSEGEANKESHRLHWDNSKAGVKRYLWVSSIFLPLGHFQPPAPWCTRPFPATFNPPLATLPFLISREPCSSLFFLLSPFQGPHQDPLTSLRPRRGKSPSLSPSNHNCAL